MQDSTVLLMGNALVNLLIIGNLVSTETHVMKQYL